MPGKIFISYRRDDQPANATLVRDRLATVYGDDQVFMDVAHLLSGENFPQRLEQELAGCDVLLAVIGPRWLELLDARTANGDRDYVKEEIATALERRIIVVPLLVAGASLPSAAQLPSELHALVARQTHKLVHESTKRDISDLVTAIDTLRERQRGEAGAALLATSPAPGASARGMTIWTMLALAVLGLGIGVAAVHFGLPLPVWPGVSGKSTVASTSPAGERCPPGALTLSDVRVMSAAKAGQSAFGSSPPLNPSVKATVSGMLKSYACQSFSNYYAKRIGPSDDIVTSKTYIVENSTELTFENVVYGNVCGSIRYEAKQLPDSNASKTVAKAFFDFTKEIQNDMIAALPDIGNQADNMVSRYMPGGNDLPVPSTENLANLTAQYQNRLINHYDGFVDKQRWTAGETQEFIVSTKCLRPLPVATGPNLNIFSNYKAAFADYQKFEADIDRQFK